MGKSDIAFICCDRPDNFPKIDEKTWDRVELWGARSGLDKYILVKQCTDVAYMGYPQHIGKSQSIMKGIISSFHNSSEGKIPFLYLYHVDNITVHGMSGGPLFLDKCIGENKKIQIIGTTCRLPDY